jgi:hypothetical protein
VLQHTPVSWDSSLKRYKPQKKLPACKSYERQDRRWGDAITSLGQKVAAGGYLAAGVSAIGGGIGIATADPALAYLGGVGFSDSLATIAIGNGLQSIGALLNGAGGNGTPVTRDFVNDRVADLLKGAPSIVKDLVKQGLDRAEDAAGVNMPQTCRMGQ